MVIDTHGISREIEKALRHTDPAVITDVAGDEQVVRIFLPDFLHRRGDTLQKSRLRRRLFQIEIHFFKMVHIAESLYTGIINDCGVFQFKNTSPGTMRTAAWLMEKGIDFNRIIDESFNNRSLIKNKVLGYCLLKAKSVLGGKCIISSITLEEMASLNASLKDLDIVVNQLKYTEGADSAVFAYESEPGVFKVSLRSSDNLDVSVTAKVFEGGGHFRAAGCTLRGSVDEVLARIVEEIRKRLGK